MQQRLCRQSLTIYFRRDFEKSQQAKLWNEFCEKKNVSKEEPYTTWAFCGGGPAADELLSLVLEGKKFGTASIHENYWKPDFERLHIDSAKNCHVVMEKFTVEYVAPGYPYAKDVISDFYFIEPNIRFAEQIIEYRNKMIEANSSMDGCLSLKRMPDPKEWVE